MEIFDLFFFPNIYPQQCVIKFFIVHLFFFKICSFCLPREKIFWILNISSTLVFIHDHFCHNWKYYFFEVELYSLVNASRQFTATIPKISVRIRNSWTNLRKITKVELLVERSSTHTTRTFPLHGSFLNLCVPLSAGFRLTFTYNGIRWTLAQY